MLGRHVYGTSRTMLIYMFWPARICCATCRVYRVVLLLLCTANVLAVRAITTSASTLFSLGVSERTCTPYLGLSDIFNPGPMQFGRSWINVAVWFRIICLLVYRGLLKNGSVIIKRFGQLGLSESTCRCSSVYIMCTMYT